MNELSASKAASAYGAGHSLDLNLFSPTFLAEIPRAEAIRQRWKFAVGAARACVVALVATFSATASLVAGTIPAPTAVAVSARETLAARDVTLLDEIQRRAVRFFIEHSDAETGLTRDRAPADGSRSTAASSVAATGFALSAWCIADSHGWMTREAALRRVQTTLRFVATRHAHERGLLYHFVDPVTGARAMNSEASTIDTAIFLKGAILAREYFQDEETTRLVNEIYSRIDWQAALNGGKTLSHGWLAGGYIPHRWDSYSELMGMYLLAMAAPQNAIPANAWHAWQRGPIVFNEGRPFIQCGPLFTHQFAHGWFDFRGVRDDYANYWMNSVEATLAQRSWSAQQGGRFASWSLDLWGLTASDGPRGYIAWGTPGPDPDQSDGTLVPCAPGGSLPFAPRECLTALHRMRDLGGEALWGRYGFADAFNPQTGWIARDVIGIDLGIMLVMAENLRTELVWRTFMKAPEVRRGMELAGFRAADPNSGVAVLVREKAIAGAME